ncbi:ribosomal protein L24 [Ordospora colligata]|uniref:Ribosomal protein L24 n=1 Tax=Ordospora colligata OC4 TaxID=1354746 RepID=A0A0B2UK52_9MICR|nr:ribosomal protein L24 [Ordospora colligata OC4]KHN69355.1 ribosomal protein L24 [Ordospora colligata OC4]TBU14869.1 ribosomal protein L24 [Ordospora colligata]TBU15000.1 ribosomal protein L24 [Ordospora colligata]TBU18254.1 ribosomal protein L24 [Ordospora colligata]
MNQGVSTYSGRSIPKGSGMFKIMNDGKVILTASNKERRLIKRCINPRDVKWTIPSREFLGKEAQYVVEKMNVQKTKIVRGFKNIGASLMQKFMAGGKPSEK